MSRIFWFAGASTAFLLLIVALVRVKELRRERSTEMLRVTLQKTRGLCRDNPACRTEVPKLLRAGANPDGQVASGSSFLLWAARRRDTGLMHLLENSGAQMTPDVRVEKLCLTANGGKPAQIQALLNAGTPVNARAFDGRSALEVAVKASENQGREMALFLLQHGADARQKTRRDSDIVSLALLYGGDLKLIRALQKVGAPTSRIADLAIAVLNNDLARVRALLDAGTPVDGRASPSEWTALQWAAYEGHPEICALLLERGADPFARSIDGRNDGRALVLLKGSFLPGTQSRQRIASLLERAEKQTRSGKAKSSR